MKPTLLLLVLTLGLAAVTVRRRTARTAAEAELWAAATDPLVIPSAAPATTKDLI